MKLVVYAVKDSAVQSYAQPMFFPTVPAAVRAFSDAVNSQDPNSQLCKHPEDFALYKVGDYDTVTGVIEPCQPVVVETALAFVREEA